MAYGATLLLAGLIWRSLAVGQVKRQLKAAEERKTHG